MSNFIAYAHVVRGCVTGEYPIASREDKEQASCIIAQSFGTREVDSRTPHGSVNEQLADTALSLASRFDMPIVAQEEVADAIPSGDVAMRITGDPSSTSGEGLDSWGVLEQARNNQEGIDTSRPLIVAQAYHVARVALQAVRLGMSPSIPPQLPREFAPNSTQRWTHSRGLWMARELPGIVALNVQGKL